MTLAWFAVILVVIVVAAVSLALTSASIRAVQSILAELVVPVVVTVLAELAALDELARLLGLEKPPSYIEAYDISNIGSDTVVAGMVVFEDARPLRRCYRKFSMKTVVGTDDYAA